MLKLTAVMLIGRWLARCTTSTHGSFLHHQPGFRPSCHLAPFCALPPARSQLRYACCWGGPASQRYEFDLANCMQSLLVMLDAGSARARKHPGLFRCESELQVASSEHTPHLRIASARTCTRPEHLICRPRSPAAAQLQEHTSGRQALYRLPPHRLCPRQQACSSRP